MHNFGSETTLKIETELRVLY